MSLASAPSSEAIELFEEMGSEADDELDSQGFEGEKGIEGRSLR